MAFATAPLVEHLQILVIGSCNGFTNVIGTLCYQFIINQVQDDDDEDEDDKPVWPTWAVGALFWGVRRIYNNHACENLCFKFKRNIRIFVHIL
jgi:hypothetical protein